jgi:putative SOS response-associated peptidase YedK
MCYAYTIHELSQLIDRYMPKYVDEKFKMYREVPVVRPTSYAPVIRNNEKKERELTVMRFGLIPFWTKDIKKLSPLCNARIETIFDKPSFKHSITSKRCIVPVSSFYEYDRSGKKPIPHTFNTKEKIISLAGIYDEWRDNDKLIESFSIITTKANAQISKIHDRMPLILPDKFESEWISNIEDKLDIDGLLSELTLRTEKVILKDVLI